MCHVTNKHQNLEISRCMLLVRACVRACVCAYVRACVRALHFHRIYNILFLCGNDYSEISEIVTNGDGEQWRQ